MQNYTVSKLPNKNLYAKFDSDSLLPLTFEINLDQYILNHTFQKEFDYENKVNF